MFQTRLLTHDYLVEGMCSTEVFEDLVIDNDYGLFVSNARVTSLGYLGGEPKSFERWRIRRTFDTVLAILVDDPSGVAAYEEAFEDYQHSVPITLHTGPFVIKGGALSPDKDPGWLETMSYCFFPVKDATITCEIPQNQLGSMSSAVDAGELIGGLRTQH